MSQFISGLVDAVNSALSDSEAKSLKRRARRITVSKMRKTRTRSGSDSGTETVDYSTDEEKKSVDLLNSHEENLLVDDKLLVDDALALGSERSGDIAVPFGGSELSQKQDSPISKADSKPDVVAPVKIVAAVPTVVPVVLTLTPSQKAIWGACPRAAEMWPRKDTEISEAIKHVVGYDQFVTVLDHFNLRCDGKVIDIAAGYGVALCAFTRVCKPRAIEAYEIDVHRHTHLRANLEINKEVFGTGFVTSSKDSTIGARKSKAKGSGASRVKPAPYTRSCDVLIVDPTWGELMVGAESLCDIITKANFNTCALIRIPAALGQSRVITKILKSYPNSETLILSKEMYICVRLQALSKTPVLDSIAPLKSALDARDSICTLSKPKPVIVGTVAVSHEALDYAEALQRRIFSEWFPDRKMRDGPHPHKFLADVRYGAQRWCENYIRKTFGAGIVDYYGADRLPSRDKWSFMPIVTAKDRLKKTPHGGNWCHHRNLFECMAANGQCAKAQPKLNSGILVDVAPHLALEEIADLVDELPTHALVMLFHDMSRGRHGLSMADCYEWVRSDDGVYTVKCGNGVGHHPVCYTHRQPDWLTSLEVELNGKRYELVTINQWDTYTARVIMPKVDQVYRPRGSAVVIVNNGAPVANASAVVQPVVSASVPGSNISSSTPNKKGSVKPDDVVMRGTLYTDVNRYIVAPAYYEPEVLFDRVSVVQTGIRDSIEIDKFWTWPELQRLINYKVVNRIDDIAVYDTQTPRAGPSVYRPSFMPISIFDSIVASSISGKGLSQGPSFYAMSLRAACKKADIKDDWLLKWISEDTVAMNTRAQEIANKMPVLFEIQNVIDRMKGWISTPINQYLTNLKALTVAMCEQPSLDSFKKMVVAVLPALFSALGCLSFAHLFGKRLAILSSFLWLGALNHTSVSNAMSPFAGFASLIGGVMTSLKYF